MLPLMKNQIKDMLRRGHDRAPFSFIARLCEGYLRAYWNQEHWDMARNGEGLFIERASQLLKNEANASRVAAAANVACPTDAEVPLPPLVLDVGANRGDWTLLLKESLPEASVHCFELVPEIFQDLKPRMAGMTGVRCHPVGLSNRSGEAQVRVFEAGDSGSSLEDVQWDGSSSEVSCYVHRGDFLLAELQAATVDILKIDVEGHEVAVLEGFGKAFAKARIRAIQFEYGRHWIPAHHSLRDAYKLLAPHGYRIGRLLPDGVQFKDYESVWDENFRSCNYVAVHESWDRLIAALDRKV